MTPFSNIAKERNGWEDRKLGRLIISRDLIRKEYQVVKEMFASLSFVWRVSHDNFTENTEYLVTCDAFDEIPEAAEIPKYVAIVKTASKYDENLMIDRLTGFTWEWRKC